MARDRAVVLLGEHLGRRQQHRLAAGVDDPEHGPQRDEGLAGADLALQETVHRVVAGQLLLEEVADLALARGELERQPLVEGLEQPPATGARAGPPGPAGRRAAGPAPAGGPGPPRSGTVAARRRPGRSRRAGGPGAARS